MPVAVNGFKVCTGCRETLPVPRFSRQAALRDGLNPKCKSCRAALEKARYMADPARAIEQSRWRVLKHRYGITRAEYEAKLAEQGGLCAICNGPQRDKRNSLLCVDHNHETGEVRGLLCTPCNLAIGYLKEDLGLLGRAADYVRKWSPSQ